VAGASPPLTRALRALLATTAIVASAWGWSAVAEAHAGYVRSNPAADARLVRPPSEVRVAFSEPPEPRGSLLEVFDAQGRKVDRGDTAPSDETNGLIVSLGEIGDGGYTVAWTALSAVDGHTTRGSFAFAVGDAPLPEIADVVETAAALVWPKRDLVGDHVLVTAGPTREPVDPVPLLVRYVSLDVDRDGRPHLAYYGRGQLRYATKPGLVWSVEVVDPRERAGWFGQIALDLSGRPHLAYYDSVDGNLWYATPDGSDWSRTRVDGSGDAGWDASLAIDPGGRPVIAYYARIPSDLRYARLDNGTWTVQVVDEEGVTGWEPSLAVGPDGTPHVAFHDWTLGALKLASGRDVLGVRTVAPSGVTTSGARLHGEVTALGPYAVANASFEWRREGDAAWSIVEALPDSEGATFEAHVGGLAPGTTYEFRAVAEAGGASAYGRIITFLTTAPERVDLYPMFFTGLSIAVLAAGVGLALWIWFLHPARVTRRGGRRPGGSV